MVDPVSILPTRIMVLGASPNPERYAYVATQRLIASGYEVFPVGVKTGSIAGVSILTGQPFIPDIHTISLYLSPAHQAEIADYILSLRPKRVIFNPGTENRELAKLLRQAGIYPEEACTLVLLSLGTFMDLPQDQTTPV